MTATLLAAAVGLAAFIGLAYRAGWSWTGFVGTQPKTLWDWLLLLLVPVGLAVVVFALNDAQNGRERRRAEHEAARARAVEVDRRRGDRLQAYLDQMTRLMLSHKLAEADLDDPVSRIASTLTATVLTELDGRRKGQVLVFLNTARLLVPDQSHVDLGHADFSHIDAHGLSFPEPMKVADADFRHANFDRALMYVDGEVHGRRAGSLSNFKGSRLQDATFRHAKLRIEFRGADLTRADFSDADLDGPLFGEACLSHTRFAGARLTDSRLEEAKGTGIDYTHTHFSWTSYTPDKPKRRALVQQHHERCSPPEPFPKPYAGR
jgi:uncharacterized protein YjbI with pentapeptide repeats